MKILYTKQFGKDLDAIQHDPKIKKRVSDFIEQVKKTDNFSEISGVKRIEGYSGYFRLRIGDYRLGLKLTEKGLEMMRFLHRKEIYRRFP
jgi:mRNA interferase RelE/StbE